MIQTAITQGITTIKEAEVHFNLVPTTEVNFFTEWREDLPQTLAYMYMMANPKSEYPTFAMITNGGEFFFIKVIKQGIPQYDISRIFSHLPLNNEFYEVLRILKKLGNSLKNVAV